MKCAREILSLNLITEIHDYRIADLEGAEELKRLEILAYAILTTGLSFIILGAVTLLLH